MLWNKWIEMHCVPTLLSFFLEQSFCFFVFWYLMVFTSSSFQVYLLYSKRMPNFYPRKMSSSCIVWHFNVSRAETDWISKQTFFSSVNFFFRLFDDYFCKNQKQKIKWNKRRAHFQRVVRFQLHYQKNIEFVHYSYRIPFPQKVSWFKLEIQNNIFRCIIYQNSIK